MVPIFSVLGPSTSIHRQLDLANGVERVEQLVDGRFAQLGISRVRHLAARDQLVAQRAFRPKRELVFSGLAVDDVFRSARMLRGMMRAGAVALLADHEQQPEIAHAFFEQALRRSDHRSDDALGVAGAASPDEFIVFARRHEGRHGIHVGRERDDRIAETGENVPAFRFHFDLFDDAVVSGAEARQVVVQILRRLVLLPE